MRTSSGGAFCSIAEEMVIVSPVRTCWPMLASPKMTSPVATPVRTTRRTFQVASSWSLRIASARWLSAAASTARSASSS